MVLTVYPAELNASCAISHFLPVATLRHGSYCPHFTGEELRHAETAQRHTCPLPPRSLSDQPSENSKPPSLPATYADHTGYFTCVPCGTHAREPSQPRSPGAWQGLSQDPVE